jgi:hypothetical protein
MKDGTASSYYQAMPEKRRGISIFDLSRIHYSRLIPFLKLIHRQRYKAEALLLAEKGFLCHAINGVFVRYEITEGQATFDISPDNGASYLNYLRGSSELNVRETHQELVNSIATIEALVKSKKHLIY